MQLPERVATIVIGNPLIADAALQSGGILVITGKGYGSTNLLALDRSGRVVMDKTVQVLGASGGDLVVVYKGVERDPIAARRNASRASRSAIRRPTSATARRRSPARAIARRRPRRRPEVRAAWLARGEIRLAGA